MSENILYSQLARKITVLLVVVSLLPLYLLSALVAYQFHTAYEAKVMAHLREIVLKHSQSIDAFLQERLANIRVILEIHPLERLADQDYMRVLLNALQYRQTGDFVDIGLVDDSGKQIAYAGPFHLEEANYSDADWFREAMDHDFYISDVFLGMRRQPHFIVAARRTCQGREYILRATIDFMTFNRLGEQLRVGETGLGFIINREGAFQTTQRTDATTCGGAELLDLAKARLGETWKEEPQLASTQARLCGGKPAVFVMSTLKSGDWVLVYRQNTADAFSDLYKTRFFGVLLLVVGTAAMLYTALLLSRRMVAHIERMDADKKAMNEQVIEASKMASLGEMAAGIAHEINNPMAVMVEEAGWVNDLLDDLEAEGGRLDVNEARRALAEIQRQGLRCKGITQKLLSFARKGDTERHELDVNLLLQETVGLMDHKVRLAGINLVCQCDSDQPPIKASQSELSQVMVNLINNAVDAMEKTGGELEIQSRRNGGCVEIRVQDNGPGIPEAILQRIFDPFFTTKPVGRGTGLGLAVCYGIIKNLGGEILVESSVGQGTLFRIIIPASGNIDGICSGSWRTASGEASKGKTKLSQGVKP